MSLTKRLNALEQAHRAMHARHEALIMVCRVMLPLISAPAVLKQRLLTGAYDALNDHMQKAGFDEEFQQSARAAVDEISHTILLNVVASKQTHQNNAQL